MVGFSFRRGGDALTDRQQELKKNEKKTEEKLVDRTKKCSLSFHGIASECQETPKFAKWWGIFSGGGPAISF